MSAPQVIRDEPIRGMPDEGHTLERVAKSCLERSGYLALHGVDCEVVGGRVLLRGRVPSYYLKQVAQALVADVAGAGGVNNQIEVG